MYSKDFYIRQSLSDALTELMKKKSLQDISVQEILNISGVSRTTFYRYFHDKYEVAMWKYLLVFTTHRDRLANEPTADNVNRVNMRELLMLFSDNAEYFLSLMQYEGQNSFREFFFQVNLNYVKEEVEQLGKHMTNRLKYMTYYHTAGVLMVIEEWLRNDRDASVEELIDVMMTDRDVFTDEVFLKEEGQFQ